MKDENKTKEQLIKELAELQQRIAELEKSETERKKVEEALKKSAIYIDAMGDALIVLNTQREVIKLNKAAKELLGYTQEEVAGLTFEKIIPEKEHKKHYAEMEIATKSGTVRSLETFVLTKDGGEIPVLLSGTVMKNPKGEPIWFVGVCRDITERKKIEKELLEADENLRIHAKELEESNIALKVLLKQREKDKEESEDTILSNVKHLVLPYIAKLKKKRLISEELTYLNILESNLKDIISPFSVKLSSKYLGFTPKEIQISNLLKDGAQDKDIMGILNISLDTAKTHRQNIRKKLGIYGKRINLRTYLLSLTK